MTEPGRRGRWNRPTHGFPRAPMVALAATAVLHLVGLSTGSLEAQEVRGRLIDADNRQPVALAGVFLLDRDRELVRGAATDTAGYYTIEAPGPGEYILFAQRLGYFENETPLLDLESGRTYGADIEMRPEPFRLDPLEVTVRNEELERHLTLELGVNPNSVLGYRAYQGIRLQEAKLKAHDNTDFLRWLYVPVTHGPEVCVGSIYVGLPERRAGSAGGERQCGNLMVDGYRVPNEHIESIELDRIVVVVLFPGQVRLYTREFDWTFRPGRPEGGPAHGRRPGGAYRE